MSQKSSVPQAISFVSQVLKGDTRDLLRPYRGSMAKWNFWQRLRDRRLVPCMLLLGQM